MNPTKSERVDDLPVVIHWLSQMCIEPLIDQELPKPHGNRQGLSYGKLAVLLLSYMITQADHRLCAVEPWVNQHHQTLELATGWKIGNKDATDDRLADLLSALGSSKHKAMETIETFLGQHLIRAYSLPTDAARSDTTSFSVYHQLSEQDSQAEKTSAPLLNKGYSKDHRPDLLQYRQMLATLDPLGIPLVSATLPGNGADDPLYVPTWKRLAEIIGHTDFLFLADSKASSWSNRGQIDREGGIYCFPVAMSGNRPKLLHDWAEAALVKLASKPGTDAQALQEKVDKLLEAHRVKEYLLVTINQQIRYPKVYSTPGRPTTDSSFRRVRQTTLTLTYQRQQTALTEFHTLAGWRLYVTNSPPQQLSLSESVFYYRQQWQPERGFHLFKRGRLPALPVYFQDEQRIRGLMFLLTIALRAFTLIEFVVRRHLADQQQSLAGLYDGNPKRTTKRPTAEQLLRAFCGITLYFHRDGSTEITPLNCVQQHILKLMNLPMSTYALPMPGPE